MMIWKQFKIFLVALVLGGSLGGNLFIVINLILIFINPAGIIIREPNQLLLLMEIGIMVGLVAGLATCIGYYIKNEGI
jgi:hypothetical protein